MKSCFIFLLLFMCGYCYAQKAAKPHRKKTEDEVVDPYKNKPFKPGQGRTMKLCIPVGKLTLNYTIRYTLLDDPDGMFYSFGQRYKAHIDTAILTGSNKDQVPAAITDGFQDRIIELTEQEIMQKYIRTTSLYYLFTVRDFNLDGKPDFAFIGDLGYHSSDVNNYVWVNINGKLVYWHNLSDVPSHTASRAQRRVSIFLSDKGSIVPLLYKIKGDTTLIPMKP